MVEEKGVIVMKYQIMEDKGIHCCGHMNFFIEEDKVNIIYDNKIKKYFLGKVNFIKGPQMFSCPWCGKKL
jgi:hypothetical protein